jgi:hypothetical protein
MTTEREPLDDHPAGTAGARLPPTADELAHEIRSGRQPDDQR